MFFTSRKKYLADNAREVSIGEDSKLPQLHRLCTDFGFVVIVTDDGSSTPKSYTLCQLDPINGRDYTADKATPEFSSLIELEIYTENHLVEIVQSYLFADDRSIQDSDDKDNAVA